MWSESRYTVPSDPQPRSTGSLLFNILFGSTACLGKHSRCGQGVFLINKEAGRFLTSAGRTKTKLVASWSGPWNSARNGLQDPYILEILDIKWQSSSLSTWKLISFRFITRYLLSPRLHLPVLRPQNIFQDEVRCYRRCRCWRGLLHSQRSHRPWRRREVGSP